ncbi:hypothetical protein IP87_01185, partial [beta proteobacterium AAP121]
PAPTPAPTPAPPPPAAVEGGSGGGGCATALQPGRADPVLPLAVLFALLALGWRRPQRGTGVVVKRSPNCHVTFTMQT